MFGVPVSVYRQAVIVLDPNSRLLDQQFPPPSPYAQVLQVYAQIAPSAEIPLSTTEVVILKTTSIPIIWDSELRHEYQELGEALSEMTEFEEADESKVDSSVYQAASYVAARLMSISCPAPRVFNHGPKSVVFNWSSETGNLYLTISADHISALISSPERIKRRLDYLVNELVDPSLVLSSIAAAYFKKPVKRLIAATLPDPLELIG
jgi:hypothetical protein